MPPVDVTHRGVSLRYLLELLDLGIVARNWTIQDVVDKVVRPKTAATKCCLFDVVPSRHTADPQYFVSHTWSRKYADLMTLLKTHFNVTGSTDAAAGVVLWLDIVALNQYPYEEAGACLLDEDADVDVVEKVVQATERTLLCLDPGCEALRRSWCLYEVWQSFVAKGAAGLRVLMPGLDEAKLRAELTSIDVEFAESTHAADSDRILELMDGGSVEVNTMVSLTLA